MNESVTYEWSEDMGRAALTAAHAAKVARLWLMEVGGLIMSVVGWWSYVRTREQAALVAGILGIIFLAIPIRIRLLYRRLAQDVKSLVDDPHVTVLLSDTGVTITSGRNTRTIDWTSVTEVLDRSGFLLVYCGRIIAASLPQQYFTQAQLEFVKSQNKR